MKSNASILIFFFVLYVFSLSWGQNFQKISNKEGFNQNTVNAIEIDKNGFLWFGTPNGLIKHDGYSFESYTSNPGVQTTLSDNYINRLAIDSSGLIWIATRNGLNAFNPLLNRFFFDTGTENKNISAIKVYRNRIWFASGNKLFVSNGLEINTGKSDISNKLVKNLKEIPYINKIHIISENKILLGTTNGLYLVVVQDILNEVSVIDSKKLEFLSRTNITSISQHNESLWIGSNEGLHQLTISMHSIDFIQTITHIEDEFGKTFKLRIRNTYVDDNNLLWIGTLQNGLVKFDLKLQKFDVYGFDQKKTLGISSPIVNAIIRDSFDVVWVGTAQGGVNKFNLKQKPFYNYSSNPFDEFSLGGNLITSVIEDINGYVWVSTYNNALSKSIVPITSSTLENLKFKQLSFENPIFNDKRIHSIFEDKDGNIWFGGDNCLVFYNTKEDVFKPIKISYKNENINPNLIYEIKQLSDSSILLIGTKIIVLENVISSKSGTYNIKALSVFKPPATEFVYTSLLNDDNSIWFGTNQGLLLADITDYAFKIKKRFVRNHSEISLTNNRVFSLKKGDGNSLWVGTFGGGLNHLIFSNDSIVSNTIYSKKNTLVDNAIYSITAQDSLNIWLSTDMGLAKLNIETGNTFAFDVRDGLPNNNFRQGAYHKGKSGYFYFGGLNGLTIFDPKKIELNSSDPQVNLVSASVGNNPPLHLNYSSKNYNFSNVSSTPLIKFNKIEKFLKLDLNVMHTAIPEKNGIKYMLKGFDEDWVEKESGKISVTYTNLNAGDYQLVVQGKNCDNIWSKAYLYVPIKVLPPWYWSWWSITIYSILIVLLLFVVNRYFLRLEKLKHQLKFEELEKQRTEELNQNKFRFFTNIAHEFRTPLTLILAPIERLIADNKEGSITQQLKLVQRNTNRLLNLVNQLISFRQAEQGYLDLKLSRMSLYDFVYPIVEIYESYAFEKDVHFFSKIREGTFEIEIDVEKTERILFNLISNAFKNTPSGGEIKLETDIISKNDQYFICFKVIDNGIGISPESIDKIFDRFYKFNSKDVSSGGGIGLAFAKNMIQLLGGSIKVKSKQGVKTVFTVTIPVTYENEQPVKNYVTPNSSIKKWLKISENETISAMKNPNLGYKTTILIVEDEEDLQTFLSDTLQKKYNILVAASGNEGLNLVSKSKIDLILSDVMMEGMDGYEFCKKIKSNPMTSHIPFIMLTALIEHQDSVKGIEYGADDYITKPFSMEYLMLRIEKFVSLSKKLKHHFSKNSTIPPIEVEINERDRVFLEKMLQIVDVNLSNSDFGVEELTKELGLSSSSLYRKIKAITGQMPNVFIRNYRFNKAAELLRSNKGLNVSEIMYEIGIESKSYFSTTFKKIYGQTPSMYSRKN